MNIYFYLFLIRIIYAYDCEEICNITISVMENLPIENLKWNLYDLLSNRTLLYKTLQFSLSNPSNYFHIESNNLLKYKLNEFDREKICQKNFLLNNYNDNDQCLLELQIFTQTSFIIIFKLIILDENDWIPLFKENYIDLNIRENLSINYRLQLPIAYDYDSNKYNIDYYQFINNINEIEKIFQLEKLHDELRLKLLTNLDCELKNNYQLYIIAVDKGGLKSNILHVNITVEDLNEYQPRFNQRFYHTRIPENISIINSSSYPILHINAIDDDCYDKIIFYSILNNDISNDIFPFKIDKYTGLLYVKSKLDYETISTYRFRIKASNIDQITSSIVPIIIDIIDINDNKPLIQMNILQEYKSNENFLININESIPIGQVIGTILIRDIDSFIINNRLSLKILSCLPLINSCPIELDSGIEEENNTLSSTNYLIRTSRKLNSELDDEKFIITLEARDYGDPSLSSQYRLIININDENDCAPKFNQFNYQFRLSISSPIGFYIGQIQAYDDDYSPDFRHIEYKIFENNNIISIDSNNGSLFLAKQLSIEMNFNITIIAVDQRNHSLYDKTNVQLIFFDETTCLPMFSKTIYVFNTTEHEIIPYEIGQINTDDCRLSSTLITYHLIKNDSLLFPFSLDSHTGKIKVIYELDREIQSFYKFYINLFNSKIQQTIKIEIQINILDINDHYPIFNNTHEQYIYISLDHQYYHEHGKMFITNIYAKDNDIDLNGLVNYYFINKDHYSYFHLYSNGSIILYNLNNIYLPIRLEISARDYGYPKPLNSKENLIIYVCNINKQNECPSNKLERNIFFGSIIIMILISLFLFIIIICIIWNLFIKNQRKKIKEKNNNSYNCRIEATKNLIVSDSLCDSSPIINEQHRLRSVVV